MKAAEARGDLRVTLLPVLLMRGLIALPAAASLPAEPVAHHEIEQSLQEELAPRAAELMVELPSDEALDGFRACEDLLSAAEPQPEKPHLGVIDFWLAAHQELGVCNSLGAPGIELVWLGDHVGRSYTGHYFDREANLYSTPSRYYDPETGRFISQDGIEYGDVQDPPSLHLYYYAYANPLRFVDLNGHETLEEEQAKRDAANLHKALSSAKESSEGGAQKRFERARAGFHAATDAQNGHVTSTPESVKGPEDPNNSWWTTRQVRAAHQWLANQFTDAASTAFDAGPGQPTDEMRAKQARDVGARQAIMGTEIPAYEVEHHRDVASRTLQSGAEVTGELGATGTESYLIGEGLGVVLPRVGGAITGTMMTGEDEAAAGELAAFRAGGAAPIDLPFGGRYKFDFDAGVFRDANGSSASFEDVQKQVSGSMGRAKQRLGMDEGDTLARLDVEDQLRLGRNSGAVEGGTDVTMKPLNAQTRTHAEGESFQRFADSGMAGKEGVLWVDRGLCGSCGDLGGIGSMLRATGMERVLVVTPDGTFMITAARPSVPIPYTIK